jgi:hypothetical protein
VVIFPVSGGLCRSIAPARRIRQPPVGLQQAGIAHIRADYGCLAALAGINSSAMMPYSARLDDPGESLP